MHVLAPTNISNLQTCTRGGGREVAFRTKLILTAFRMNAEYISFVFARNILSLCPLGLRSVSPNPFRASIYRCSRTFRAQKHQNLASSFNYPLWDRKRVLVQVQTSRNVKNCIVYTQRRVCWFSGLLQFRFIIFIQFVHHE